MARMETRTEYVYKGKRYVPQDAARNSCDGCAFDGSQDTAGCDGAGYCSNTSRDDGRTVIWVEAE